MNENQFYTILSVSSVDYGSEKPLNLLTQNKKNLINSNIVFNLSKSIKIKLFNLEIPKTKSEYDPEKYLTCILNLFKAIGNQTIDLIIINIPLNIIRLNEFFIRQAFRILGRNCKNNIIALLTNLDLLSEEAKKLILINREESIHESLKDNMVLIRNEDIKVFEENDFVDFLAEKIKKIKSFGYTNFKIVCFEKFNKHYLIDGKEIKAFLNMKSEDECFFNFVLDYKGLDDYINMGIEGLLKRGEPNIRNEKKNVCCKFMKNCLDLMLKKKGYFFSMFNLLAGFYIFRKCKNYFF
jgi:hypothetical protein